MPSAHAHAHAYTTYGAAAEVPQLEVETGINLNTILSPLSTISHSPISPISTTMSPITESAPTLTADSASSGGFGELRGVGGLEGSELLTLDVAQLMGEGEDGESGVSERPP